MSWSRTALVEGHHPAEHDNAGPRKQKLLANIKKPEILMFFTTLDLASGYWQIQSSREKTAFAVPHGLFEFQVMPLPKADAASTGRIES